MKEKKDSKLTLLLVVFLFIGVCLLLYPTVADLWNQRVASYVMDNYAKQVGGISEEERNKEFEKARQYNDKLKTISFPLANYDQADGYNEAFNINKDGVMGIITIPKINVELPIYHGTSDDVLRKAVGHLEGSSLPTGGIGNHTILSAHRGLPSARLFTCLDQLKEGDTFSLKILDQELTYEVDQIRIVDPSDTAEALISEGNDYCTLLTCTPYGINSQRLLVRGVRVPNNRGPLYISTEAFELDSLFLAPAVAAPMLLVWMVVLIVRGRKARQKREEMQQNQDRSSAGSDGDQASDADDAGKKKFGFAGKIKQTVSKIRSKGPNGQKKDG
ncbi:MAG: class C sortase [Erysipelotrichaceae bacterium]|nr:class C sortase [Erysipelotrichaceae bacterium]